MWPLAHGLADLDPTPTWVPEGSVALAGDDTVDEHRGAHVYGKGAPPGPCSLDPQLTPPYRWGHKWVVLAILVRFPFANRPWGPPRAGRAVSEPGVGISSIGDGTGPPR